MNRLAFLLLCVALLSGCYAMGVKFQYNDITPKTQFETRAKIAVGVHDQRSYIVSGEKDPTFVGQNRNGWGIPFDVKTQSGLPLASEFQNSITNALSRAGATVVRADLGPGIKPLDAQRLMLSAGADKAFLVTIYEWKSDAFVDVNLRYELLANVVGVTTKRLTGDERIGKMGEYFSSSSASAALVPVAYKKKLEEMLSDPAIVSALQ